MSVGTSILVVVYGVDSLSSCSVGSADGKETG